VTNGDGDVQNAGVSIPALADLPSRIAKPEGGPLKLATLATKQAPTLSALDRACLSARVAAEHKARDIVVLDMRGITPLYDFFVLATGNSRRQIHTISEEIDDALHENGDRRLSIEGYEASKWVVQDYGDVVVHVFNPDTRQYYAIEDLWADAPRVDWERYY
jgi:ribosome-associated protein